MVEKKKTKKKENKNHWARMLIVSRYIMPLSLYETLDGLLQNKNIGWKQTLLVGSFVWVENLLNK